MLRRWFGFVACSLVATGSTSPISLAIAQSNSQTPANDVSASVTPVQQQYGDWFHRCVDVALPQESKDKFGKKIVKQCEVVQIQQVKRGEETVTVLSVAIALSAPDKKGQRPNLLMTSVTPLNVYLPAGLRFSIAGKDVIKSDYRNCNQSGCWAQKTIDRKTLTALQKAVEAEGHFRLVGGQNVNIKFSLKGFSEAIAALEKGATLP